MNNVFVGAYAFFMVTTDIKKDRDNTFWCYFIPFTIHFKDRGSSVEHNQKAAGFTSRDTSVYRGSKL